MSTSAGRSPVAAGVLAVTALLATACASTSSQTPPNATGTAPTMQGRVWVSGVVLGEPGCPGPARLDSPCPPLAMPGATVDAEQNGRLVAETSAATGGYFELELPPGSYRIVATAPGPVNSKAGKDITVGTARVTVDLTVDTGMR